MGNFRIFTTEEFDEEFKYLDKSGQIKVNKIFKQLKESGDKIGKPLSGLSFFREKKFGNKRLYYLVYNDISIILTVALSDKKTQQTTINKILLDISEYQLYVFDVLRKKGII